MAIFAPYQGGDPFQVGPNMQNVLAQQRNIQQVTLEGIEKFNQASQEMDVLRSTTNSILSQFPLGQDGKPLPAAPKYVHDLYKSVEKEGGIQGLSKSSLIAALKGYETGFQVEAQQMQVRAAQQAETLRGYQIEQAKREADEARKIALAHKLAMESLGTPSGRIETATAPTLATDMPADMGNEIYKYYTGQRSTDPREATVKPQPTAQPSAKPTAKPTAKPASQSKTLEQKVTPETAERDALEAKLSQASANESIVRLKQELSLVEKRLIDARKRTKLRFAPSGIGGPAAQYETDKTLDEINADKLAEKEIVPRIDNLKKQIAELQAIADKPLPEAPPKPAGATPVGPVALDSDVNRNSKQIREFLENNNPEEVKQRHLAEVADVKSEIDRLTYQVEKGTYDTPEVKQFEEKYGMSLKQRHIDQLVELRAKLSTLQTLGDSYSFTLKNIEKGVVANPYGDYTKPIGPVAPKDEINPAFAPTAVPSSVAPKATSKPLSKAKPKPKAEPQPQAVNYRPELKSDDEKIAEEYGQLTSRLKSLGSVPLNWSEDTFRQMRGYAPKIRVIPQGGFALVGIGDKWQVMKTGGENQMSPSELASHEKHLMLKDAIRTDKMTTKKWTFAGDIRTTETDTAGKVKKSVLDTTRALDALDKLIEVGQDTGFWDSITPTERAGIIEGVTNSVQAAGRTEIAGSGAFSEQDAKKLESIVPSLASISGAVFKETTLSKLKTYRERMAQQVKDIGRTWGFQVSEATDTGLTPEQTAFMRDRYRELVKQGYSHEDAKQLAIESLSQQ